MGRSRGLLSAAVAWRATGTAPEIDQRLKLRDRDGEPRWIAIRGRLIADPRRPLVLIAIGIVRDVTEREELLRQKDSLMAELNHRTKNSLQLVASLLRLESRGIEDPDSRRRFVEASTRVGSIAAVHDGLDRTADLKRVRLGPLVRRLCDDLAGIRCRDDVVRVDPLVDAALETDRAIPLAIILNELVTNALTYGRRRDGIATVRVGMSVCDGDTLLLSVADEGPGLPSDFALSRPRGLGLQLVTALTRQIGGRIDVDTDQEGVTFQIRFPADQDVARP
jgi:two-component sensor histidine kinase